MTQLFFIALTVLFSFTAQAQTPVKKADLLGNWKAVKVEMVNILTADEKGVVFSEEFLATLTEDEKPMTKGLLEGMMGAMIGSEASYEENGTYTETSTKGKKNQGTYSLDKSGKKLTITLNGKKNEFLVKKVGEQLVLTQNSKQGEMILTYAKQ